MNHQLCQCKKRRARARCAWCGAALCLFCVRGDVLACGARLDRCEPCGSKNLSPVLQSLNCGQECGANVSGPV